MPVRLHGSISTPVGVRPVALPALQQAGRPEPVSAVLRCFGPHRTKPVRWRFPCRFHLWRRASDRAPVTAYSPSVRGLAPRQKTSPALSLHPAGTLCAAVLTALLLARIDPGATYLAPDQLPSVLLARFGGLTKTSQKNSPESSPCQKIFANQARNSTGFGKAVNLLRRTRITPQRTPRTHPLCTLYSRPGRA